MITPITDAGGSTSSDEVVTEAMKKAGWAAFYDSPGGSSLGYNDLPVIYQAMRAAMPAPSVDPVGEIVERRVLRIEWNGDHPTAAVYEEDGVEVMRCSIAAMPAPSVEVRHLRELLAVIHRDGGHYLDQHGMEKAVADALQLSSERIVSASVGSVGGVGRLLAHARAMHDHLGHTLPYGVGNTFGSLVDHLQQLADDNARLREELPVWTKAAKELPPLHTGVLVGMRDCAGSAGQTFDVACYTGLPEQEQGAWIGTGGRFYTRQIDAWTHIPTRQDVAALTPEPFVGEPKL